MSAPSWEDIRRHFDEAADLDGEARKDYLASLAIEDPSLYKEVYSLLENISDEEDSDFLVTPASNLPDLFADNLTEGTTFDHYTIVKRIAAGGMGVVYLAHHEMTDKNVALKVVKRGMDSEEILHRFRAESRILASLEHPNIAQLLDGGITPDGRPYFVMSYVAGGKTILQYCNENKLNIKARIDLFRTVCNAVQFAHQNLIIHRDLKPQNILISETGEVKLLDFGIAKLLDPSAQIDTNFVTVTGHMMMTPEYASPEQINGDPIGTASDIYALGVLLYRLFTGVTPYIFENRSREEIIRVVTDVKPPNPSIVVQVDADQEENEKRFENATKRGTSPVRLHRQLKGDLDTIIRKAIHKDAGRRYVSAEQFSQDLKRHLLGLPIRAQKDTFTYRSTKFIRRNRLPIAFLSIFIVVISIFATSMFLQSKQIEAERDRAESERDRAEQVAIFLKDLLQGADPWYAGGESLSANDLLNRGTAKIREELGNDLALQGEMLDIVGQIYYSLGEYDVATSLLTESISKSITALGKNHVQVDKARVHLAEMISQRGNNEEVEAAFNILIPDFIARRGENDKNVVALLLAKGHFLRQSGQYDESKAYTLDALRISNSIFDRNNPALAHAMNDAALLARYYRDFAKADSLFSLSQQILVNNFGLYNPDVAKAINNRARLFASMGNRDSAIFYDKKALDVRKKIYFEQDHPDIAQSLSNLATDYYFKKDYENAIPLYEQAFQMIERNSDPNHPDVTKIMNNLAHAYRAIENYGESERLFLNILSRQQIFWGEKLQISIPRSYYAIARVRIEAGNFNDAIEPTLKAKDLYTTLNLVTTPRYVARCNLFLAQIAIAQNRPIKADALIKGSLKTLQELGLRDTSLAHDAREIYLTKWPR